MAPQFLLNFIPKRDKATSASSVIPALRALTFIQWAQFWSGWLAWTCDALDFFSVSLTVSQLALQFGKKTATITTAITLTLLFRSIGAIVFGVLSDRFGRKWPLVCNLILCCVFSLGTGFTNTFPQFLAVRSLFGIAMGGIWGLSSSTALENLPVELRGLASGVLQQGYAVGYLIAAVINLTVVAHSSQTWRTLFWTGAGITFFAAIVRAVIPESEVFLRAKAIEKAKGTDTTKKTKVFVRETKEMLKLHWKLCIYAVLLMTGFNFLSHGSQDLYPTYLETSKGFSTHDATIATIIGNCVCHLLSQPSLLGGAISGYTSQYIGRRLTIIICVLLVGAFIPLWILPYSFSALAAGAFCVQFGVQGAWGVIPIQLAEMSPPAFRATFPGVSYQLGNMVSSASAQIEATAASHLHTTIIKDGVPTSVIDYATVQGIFIGIIAAYVLLVTVFGPENHSSHFEKHKTAFEEGGGRDDAIMEDEQGGNADEIREADEKGSV
ncbi:carboxylic acid transporter protein [Melanogaster broomeanus]|nr:carboxylic acid transporter protein [Melanogaster broomeanus]